MSMNSKHLDAMALLIETQKEMMKIIEEQQAAIDRLEEIVLSYQTYMEPEEATK